MARGKLFTVAILYHPPITKDKDGNEKTPKSIVVKEPHHILAANDQQAGLIAAKTVPEEYMDQEKLDGIEILIRPF